ncbi:hypothetical protein [Arthrobacter sp. CAN_A212]
MTIAMKAKNSVVFVEAFVSVERRFSTALPVCPLLEGTAEGLVDS